jgi:hypothetical protein
MSKRRYPADNVTYCVGADRHALRVVYLLTAPIGLIRRPVIREFEMGTELTNKKGRQALTGIHPFS